MGLQAGGACSSDRRSPPSGQLRVRHCTRQPDLLVLDLGLPDGDGVPLIRDVRGWSGVPIIVLSARTDEADKIAALDAGADDYLTKPFGTGELLARVRANLRRPRAAAGGAAEDSAEPVFRFGEIEVDRAARIVRREGAEASDVVPFTQARANLSDLADQAKAGAEKIITKNGESYVALIDADRLDYYHRLERERIHLLLLDDARRGLEDIAAGRTWEADAALARRQQQRRASGVARKPAKRG